MLHMDTLVFLQTQMTVEDVLKNWPGTSAVFLERKTTCVGCLLQRFCTLKDVAETYRIPLQDLRKDLEECALITVQNQRSTL